MSLPHLILIFVSLIMNKFIVWNFSIRINLINGFPINSESCSLSFVKVHLFHRLLLFNGSPSCSLWNISFNVIFRTWCNTVVVFRASITIFQRAFMYFTYLLLTVSLVKKFLYFYTSCNFLLRERRNWFLGNHNSFFGLSIPNHSSQANEFSLKHILYLTNLSTSVSYIKKGIPIYL